MASPKSHVGVHNKVGGSPLEVAAAGPSSRNCCGQWRPVCLSQSTVLSVRMAQRCVKVPGTYKVFMKSPRLSPLR